MPPPTIGAGTLRRLRESERGGRSVLSVYLEVDPTTDLGVSVEKLERLSAGMRERIGEERLEQVLAATRALPALRPGARGLAMFFDLDGGESTVTIQLPSQVQELVVLDSERWLEPLAASFTEGDWGVAILSAQGARLLRGRPQALVEFATIHNGCGFLGDRSGSLALSVLKDDLVSHAQRLARLLLRAHRRQAFAHLVIAAPKDRWSSVARALDSELRSRIVDFTTMDLAERSPHDVARLLLEPLSEAQSRKTKRDSSSTFTGRSQGIRVAMRRTSGAL